MATDTTVTARLFVVSRDSAMLRPLLAIAEPNCWQIETAVNAWDAVERVESGAVPDLLVLDLPRGENDFLHVLRWMGRIRPDLPVVVTCAAEDGRRQRDITRLGAQEVLVKPLDESRLGEAIQRHLVVTNDLGAEIASEHIEPLGPDSFFVSGGVVSHKLRAQAELLAQADVPALVLGESGSGKKTVARLIHKLSIRSGFEFLTVNCADMPDDLLGAELFGAKKSGLANSRNAQGKIERAERGTIFLDEITEMPLTVQARLMEALQGRVPLSSEGEKGAPAAARILASTSANISRALDEGRLREDLYHRLSAFTIRVPPLRQRKGEIAFLLQHTMHRLSKRYGLPRREFSDAMLLACQQYSWPGNLTELENFTKRYLVAGGAEFNFHDHPKPDGARDVIGFGEAPKNVVPFPSRGEGLDVRRQPGTTSLKTLIQNVKGEAERNAIETALQKTGWNRKAASRLLQVSYRTLLYKIDQYHMSATDPYLPALPPNMSSLDRAMPRRDKKD